MNITEKILASHAGLPEVSPGDMINVSVDIALCNDISGPIAIREFERIGTKKVFDQTKIYLVADHHNPCKDIQSAEQTKILREFAREYDLSNYFEAGRMGIEHCLLPELGCIKPGQIIIGADSHTCTYGALGAFATGVGSTDLAAVMATGVIWLKVPESIKYVYHGRLQPWVAGKDLILSTIGYLGTDGAQYETIEFVDQTEQKLSVESRLCIANMAIEAGAKNGIFEPDAEILNYLGINSHKVGELLRSDPGAAYRRLIDYDVSVIEPQVACPPSPSNVCSVREVGRIRIDQVVLGCCTNGRIEDLRVAAKLLKGHKVHPSVRMIIIPGTQRVFLQAVKEGLVEMFIEAGAVFSTPTCGPCLGGHMGVLASNEVAVSTTNRNFIGRMGHAKSSVYLTGPAVAAASAVVGIIAHPEDIYHG